LERQAAELNDRERDLEREINARPLNPNAYQGDYQSHYVYSPFAQQTFQRFQQPTSAPMQSQQQMQQAQTLFNSDALYGNLRNRAQADGIRLNTAGNLHSAPTASVNSPIAHHTSVAQQQAPKGQAYYNIGLTLFKTAFIVFCIVAFESLVVFFMKDLLKVSPAYPAVGFSAGFVMFLTCCILYAMSYKPNAKRKKHPSYLITMAVMFVISVIVVTMVAVYCKAQMSDPAQLLSYVIIPVAYLLNILIFALFYRTFSVKDSVRK
jgi:hypothetical protein